MLNPHHIIRKELELDKTINLKELIGKKILSFGGKVIGKISQIRINPTNLNLEGILIKRDIFGKPLYIGKSYFSHLSHDAVILNIEISLLIKGKNVITSGGKIIGKVTEVVRKGSTNDIKVLMVRSFFSRRFLIPASAIKYIGKSVILKPNYNAKKKYFWQKVE
ncbi:MAG: PRC-barrel domain-containing protein [Nanoarchaeota archaeon]|nr:PRC-barrel domain-containing protein [Nanoarchaeota archaeon]